MPSLISLKQLRTGELYDFMSLGSTSGTLYQTGDQTIYGHKTFSSGASFVGDYAPLLFGDDSGNYLGEFYGDFTYGVGIYTDKMAAITANQIDFATSEPWSGVRYNSSYLLSKDQADTLYIDKTVNKVGYIMGGVSYHFDSGIYYGKLLAPPEGSYDFLTIDIVNKSLKTISSTETGAWGFTNKSGVDSLNWSNGLLYSYKTGSAGSVSGYSGISLDWFNRILSGNWETNAVPTQSGHIINKGYLEHLYLSGSGNATPPSNTSTPVTWMDVWVSGVKYKTPLYL